MKKRGNVLNKKGQITLFIIIGIIIVALAVLIYLFWPNIQGTFGLETKTPNAYMQTCLEEKINEAVNILSLQGGSIEPELYYAYDGDKIEVLCYAERPYVQCVMQQPMLVSHVEEEIKVYINSSVAACLQDMKDSFSGRGYNVNLGSGGFEVELLPKRIAVVFDSTVALRNQASGEIFDSINFGISNNLYELLGITNSILGWETSLGDAETTLYMDYYHDLKVEKYKQTDGTTIYVLTDRNNGNKFQFASKSVWWPSGYGA